MDKSDLKTGDVLHCMGSGLLSRIIGFFTKSEITHSAMVIEVWGMICVIDAQADGVNIRPFDEWEKKYNYKWICTRPVYQQYLDQKSIAIRATSKSGSTAYDFNGLLIRHPFRLISNRYKMRFRETEKMYCSEFVAWVYNIPHFYRLTPNDLFKYCVSHEFVNVGNNLPLQKLKK